MAVFTILPVSGLALEAECGLNLTRLVFFSVKRKAFFT
jgi:hypothetical protein